jgi:EAL domain-containing protein (putative c-di-GMP-specific phosphodiesterase class I)/FixJ family two-component response regulator
MTDMLLAAADPLPPALPSALARGSVLIVDDSAAHRLAMTDLMRELGCGTLHTASDGQAALDFLCQCPQLPALVIMDLEMPGMDGVELVQTLAERNLRPPVIIASDAAASIISSVAMIVEDLNFPFLGSIRKPVAREAMRRALLRFGDPAESVAQAGQGSGAWSHETLRQAIVKHDIVPWYQPKIDLSTGDVVGVEALARWQDVEPSHFIAAAEQSGMICDLTRSLLDHSLQDLRRWKNLGAHLSLSLNVSPMLLAERSFADRVTERCAAAGVHPGALVLELTENTLATGTAAFANLASLRLKGFGISIDDYGVGYSSLQQLSRVACTELKIDRSFVHGAVRHRHLRTIVESAIEMGYRLGVTTVAEGVETEEELSLLRSLGCHLAQGYVVARPMPGSEVVSWMKRRQAAHACKSGNGC